MKYLYSLSGYHLIPNSSNPPFFPCLKTLRIFLLQYSYLENHFMRQESILPIHQMSNIEVTDSHFYFVRNHLKSGLPWWLSSKEPACQSNKLRFYPWVRKFPWRREWQPNPVFLPGKSHGQRSLAGSMGQQKSLTGLGGYSNNDLKSKQCSF